MKKLTCILLAVATLVLTGCHEHTWTDATCTQPMTCQECGETEGEMLGHTWSNATCTEPKTCKICGTTEGEVIDHVWKDATCINPETCNVCGKQQGEPVDHDWIEATCAYPKKCTVCYETEGEAKVHDFAEATYSKPKTCKNCGHTVGDALDASLTQLAWGEDRITGDVYRLVAKETEDYSGVAVQIGVIKNDNWLIEMTSDIPLIDEDKTLYGVPAKGLSTAPKTIYYIGHGCFYYENMYKWGTGGRTYEAIVYNVETGKYHELTTTGVNHPTVFTCEDYTITKNGDLIDEDTAYSTSQNEYIIWQAIPYSNNTLKVTLLNVKTMKTKEVSFEHFEPKVYPFSEGLFAVTTFHGDFIFYDVSGNVVLDLSEYELAHDYQPLFFNLGKCTFEIYNNANNLYKITIDAQGNVISSVEVE